MLRFAAFATKVPYFIFVTKIQLLSKPATKIQCFQRIKDPGLRAEYNLHLLRPHFLPPHKLTKKVQVMSVW